MQFKTILEGLAQDLNKVVALRKQEHFDRLQAALIETSNNFPAAWRAYAEGKKMFQTITQIKAKEIKKNEKKLLSKDGEEAVQLEQKVDTGKAELAQRRTEEEEKYTVPMDSLDDFWVDVVNQMIRAMAKQVSSNFLLTMARLKDPTLLTSLLPRHRSSLFKQSPRSSLLTHRGSGRWLQHLGGSHGFQNPRMISRLTWRLTKRESLKS